MAEDRSEAALRARARYMNADQIIGTDLITVEIGGWPGDFILTTEDAKYLHAKLADLLGLTCGELEHPLPEPPYFDEAGEEVEG